MFCFRTVIVNSTLKRILVVAPCANVYLPKHAADIMAYLMYLHILIREEALMSQKQSIIKDSMSYIYRIIEKIEICEGILSLLLWKRNVS